jgi:hypothetical protein
VYKKDMLDDGSGEAGRLLYILLSIRSAELEFASGFAPTDGDVGFQV